MPLLNYAFILSLIEIKSFQKSKHDQNDIFEVNNQRLSKNICNRILWKALLKLIDQENFITIENLLNYFQAENSEAIIKIGQLITSDNVIYFYDFNHFLNNISTDDYYKLINHIMDDGLLTPSDWSVISSDDESIDYNKGDEIINPLSISPENKSNNEEVNVNTQVTVKFYDPQTIKSPNLVKRVKPTPLYPTLSHNDATANSHTTNVIIDTQPEEINNSINEPKTAEKDKRKEYSWYINYLIRLNEYLKQYTIYKKINSYIGVPNWVKKYF